MIKKFLEKLQDSDFAVFKTTVPPLIAQLLNNVMYILQYSLHWAYETPKMSELLFYFFILQNKWNKMTRARVEYWHNVYRTLNQFSETGLQNVKPVLRNRFIAGLVLRNVNIHHTERKYKRLHLYRVFHDKGKKSSSQLILPFSRDLSHGKLKR